jgi:hypothetical protein
VLIVPKKIQIKPMSNQVLNHPRPQSVSPCSRKILLYIRLSESSAPGVRLSNPPEVACAEAVAGYLSGRFGRPVSLAEPERLSLYLWSEHDLEGKELGFYLGGDRPLQGLLLETRQEDGDGSSGVSDELARFVGARFEFAAAAVMDEPTF